MADGYFPIAGNIWSCPTTTEGRWIQGAFLFIVLMLIWVWFNTVLIVDYDSFDMFMQAIQNCALIYEFGFTYHDSLREWLDPILGIALFDLGLIHFKCLDQRWDFVWAFWLQMSVAFVWAFFEIVWWLLSTGRHPRHMRSAKEQTELNEAKRKIRESNGISEVSEGPKKTTDPYKLKPLSINPKFFGCHHPADSRTSVLRQELTRGPQRHRLGQGPGRGWSWLFQHQAVVRWRQR